MNHLVFYMERREGEMQITFLVGHGQITLTCHFLLKITGGFRVPDM